MREYRAEILHQLLSQKTTEQAEKNCCEEPAFFTLLVSSTVLILIVTVLNLAWFIKIIQAVTKRRARSSKAFTHNCL